MLIVALWSAVVACTSIRLLLIKTPCLRSCSTSVEWPQHVWFGWPRPLSASQSVEGRTTWLSGSIVPSTVHLADRHPQGPGARLLRRRRWHRVGSKQGLSSDPRGGALASGTWLQRELEGGGFSAAEEHGAGIDSVQQQHVQQCARHEAAPCVGCGGGRRTLVCW